MSDEARQYLLERFLSDAKTLRSRAASLGVSRPPAGPDAATSTRMAEACDRVAALIRSLPANEPPGIMLQSLATLALPLEDLARESADSPAVRSVYVGAATRIRELLAKEASAARRRDDPAASRRRGDDR